MKLVTLLRRLLAQLRCRHSWQTTIHGELGIQFVRQVCSTCQAERVRTEVLRK